MIPRMLGLTYALCMYHIPLQSLPYEVNSYFGTNARPEHNQGETKIQSWFNDRMDIFNNTWKVVAIDTHSNPHHNGLKPDISIFDSNITSDGAPFPMFVRTLLELKQRKSRFLTI